jgi:hypothetical protein
MFFNGKCNMRECSLPQNHQTGAICAAELSPNALMKKLIQLTDLSGAAFTFFCTDTFFFEAAAKTLGFKLTDICLTEDFSAAGTTIW